MYSETNKTTECICIQRQTMRRYKLTDDACDAIAY